MFTFQRSPFGVIFLSFAAGLLLESWLREAQFVPVVLLIGALVFIFADHRAFISGYAYFSCVSILTVLAGTSYMQFSSHEGQAEKFLKAHEQEKTVVLDILEVKAGDGDWNRAIGNIQLLRTVSGFETADAQLLLFVEKSDRPIAPGDRLFINSKVEPIRNKGNPGEFDAEMFWGNKRVGLISFARTDQYAVSKGAGEVWFERITNYVRDFCMNKFIEHFGDQEAAVLSAVVLGEKSLLNEETKNSFMNTGAMHVLAVSGLHIGLILYLLLFVAERFSAFISRRTALLVLVGFFWFYAFLTGASPSVIRAVFMFSMLAFSQLLSRRYDPVNILFFTAFVLLLIDPYTLYDIGFQLSYLAMLGIYLFYKPIEESVQFSNKWLRKIWQGTAIGFAAQICTTPLSLIYFNQFPNYFILSNLGLMATSGLILGLGIIFPLIAGVPVLSSVIVLFLSVTVMVTLWFLSWVEHLPGAVVYGYNVTWVQLMFISVGVVLLFELIRSRYRLFLAAAFLVIGIGGITYDRYEKMNYSEVRILNHSRPVVLVKNRDNIFCFYANRKKDRVEKIDALLVAYSRVYPGNVKLIDFSGRKFKLKTGRGEFRIEDGRDAVWIDVPGKTYKLRKSNDEASSARKTNFSIGMPWVSANVDYCLAEGSLKLF